MMYTFIPVHITFMYTGLFDAEPCHRARENNGRGAGAGRGWRDNC